MEPFCIRGLEPMATPRSASSKRTPLTTSPWLHATTDPAGEQRGQRLGGLGPLLEPSHRLGGQPAPGRQRRQRLDAAHVAAGEQAIDRVCRRGGRASSSAWRAPGLGERALAIRPGPELPLAGLAVADQQDAPDPRGGLRRDPRSPGPRGPASTRSRPAPLLPAQRARPRARATPPARLGALPLDAVEDAGREGGLRGRRTDAASRPPPPRRAARRERPGARPAAPRCGPAPRRAPGPGRAPRSGTAWRGCAAGGARRRPGGRRARPARRRSLRQLAATSGISTSTAGWPAVSGEQPRVRRRRSRVRSNCSRCSGVPIRRSSTSRARTRSASRRREQPLGRLAAPAPAPAALPRSRISRTSASRTAPRSAARLPSSARSVSAQAGSRTGPKVCSAERNRRQATRAWWIPSGSLPSRSRAWLRTSRAA